MIIPIRFYTCNKLLADKYEYYERELLRKKLAMGNTDEDPLIININATDVKKTIAQMKSNSGAKLKFSTLVKFLR